MDVSNLLCLWMVHSFQPSICVVFFSYWRDLSKHVLLFLMASSFCLSFLFSYNMIGVRDLLYCSIWRVWETCHNVSLFFWCSVLIFFLFVCPFSFVMIWWVWETCYTVGYYGWERPVIPCCSFSDVESFLFFLILCTGCSTFTPSYYLQSRLWIYMVLQRFYAWVRLTVPILDAIWANCLSESRVIAER